MSLLYSISLNFTSNQKASLKIIERFLQLYFFCKKVNSAV